jgi:hypothetical protein
MDEPQLVGVPPMTSPDIGVPPMTAPSIGVPPMIEQFVGVPSTTTGKKKSLFSDGIEAEEVVIIGLVVTSATILILLSVKLYTTRM